MRRFAYGLALALCRLDSREKATVSCDAVMRQIDHVADRELRSEDPNERAARRVSVPGIAPPASSADW